MSAATNTNDTADLPEFPGARDARCPFDPPPTHTEWRAGEGLERIAVTTDGSLLVSANGEGSVLRLSRIHDPATTQENQ
jgi:hypothetical protein